MRRVRVLAGDRHVIGTAQSVHLTPGAVVDLDMVVGHVGTRAVTLEEAAGVDAWRHVEPVDAASTSEAADAPEPALGAGRRRRRDAADTTNQEAQPGPLAEEKE